jgi:transposase-like protein
MANLRDYEKLTERERLIRNFSEEFKRKKVSEIERNLIGISELSREYQVSATSIHR